MMDMKPKRELAYPKLKQKRDELRAQNRCICGPWDPSTNTGKRRGIEHGPVVRGGRCQRCWDVAKKSRGGKKKP
jgi:hypothetical protein